jgi:hypothetical protein
MLTAYVGTMFAYWVALRRRESVGKNSTAVPEIMSAKQHQAQTSTSGIICRTLRSAIGDTPFWTLHLDTLIVSGVVGLLLFGLCGFGEARDRGRSGQAADFRRDRARHGRSAGEGHFSRQE